MARDTVCCYNLSGKCLITDHSCRVEDRCRDLLDRWHKWSSAPYNKQLRPLMMRFRFIQREARHAYGFITSSGSY